MPILAAGLWTGCWHNAAADMSAVEKLPEPSRRGSISIEETLHRRRSVRSYTDRPLSQAEIGQLCWSALGVTDPVNGFRTAPSAGATFPLELYVATPDGVFHYLPHEHALRRRLEEDVRRALRRAALDQPWVERAPAVFIFAADLARIAPRYRDRAERYTWMEIGHASENLLLQAVALGLGGVPVGAFDEAETNRILRLPKGQRTFYLVPVGEPR